MISSFTRAMISSTTGSAGERDGSNSAYATANSRGSLIFFIRPLSKRSLETRVRPEGNCFSILRRQEHGGQLGGRAWSANFGRLISSRERQRGHVVVLWSRVHEVLHALQDALGKVFCLIHGRISGRRRARLHDALDSVQAEFHVHRLGLHHPARNQRQRALRPQANDASVGGGEREQT